MTRSRLTWAQQIVWTGHQIVPGGSHYNQAFCLDLSGALDVSALQAAFVALCADVDALRLVFEPKGDGSSDAYQSATGRAPQLEVLRMGSREEAQSWMQADALAPFDLTQSCTRAALIEIGPEQHVFFIVQHHLVCDGVSVSLLFDALAKRYAAARGNSAPEPLAQYLDAAPALQDAKPTEAFDATAEMSALPLYNRPIAPGGTAKVSVPLELSPERLERLKALAASPDFRAFTPLMAQQAIISTVVAAWLSRISGQAEVAFAMPQHNRVSPASRTTIGLFMEMLPLALTVEPDDSFASLHARMTGALRNVMVHGGPGTTRVDLLRHRNVILNVFAGRPIEFDGLSAKAQMVPVAASDPAHDINIEFADFEGTGSFSARMAFDASRFDSAARSRAVGHFLALLDAFLADPKASIAAVDILTAPEHNALRACNAEADAPQPDGTVLDRFAANLSDAPAVRDTKSGASLSHHGLDSASNQLAHLLVSRGARAGDMIGIYLPRSLETIVAILAIQKLGAAFVPLEANLAPERRDFILRDTGAAVVVSDAEIPGAVSPSESTDFPTTALSTPAPQPSAPAYVIYTSGTTGTPKGVVVGHCELLGYCEMCSEQYPLAPGQSFAFFSAFGFDLTINSLFMPLISGGEIVVYPEPEQGGDMAILDVFADDAVDVLKPTPSHLRMGILNATKPLKRIKYLPHSGEAFPADLAREAHSVLGAHLVMINEYGPTEAVVGAMMHHFDPKRDQGALVPLGRPAPGMRIAVLNAALAHQPIGVLGEIAIGGRLAQGYLNRAELTDAKFVADPHHPGARLYLTGDLGVFDGSGDLLFLGRLDDQIKINGIRLELGEIEHAISKCPGVDTAVAALKPGPSGAPALVAYVTGCASRAAIADAARLVLPISVSLGAVVSLERLPLSSNGKIARGQLPDPAQADWLAKTGSRKANTPDEIALADIWAEVLGLEHIGAEDDFYALGGNSLNAVRITHAARAKGHDVAAVDIFKFRTIAKLAATLQPQTASPPQRPQRKRFSRLSGDMQAQLAGALKRSQ